MHRNALIPEIDDIYMCVCIKDLGRLVLSNIPRTARDAGTA